MIIQSEYVEPYIPEGFVSPPNWMEMVCKVQGHKWDYEVVRGCSSRPVVVSDKIYTLDNGDEVKHCSRCDHIEFISCVSLSPMPLHTTEALCLSIGHSWQTNSYFDFLYRPGDSKFVWCRRCRVSKVIIDDRQTTEE